MSYNNELTWGNLVGQAAISDGAAKQAIINGEEAYQEWTSFAGARANVQIATALTALGRTTTAAEVAELRAAFDALHAVYQFVTNVAAPVAGDRMADWRKVT